MVHMLINVVYLRERTNFFAKNASPQPSPTACAVALAVEQGEGAKKEGLEKSEVKVLSFVEDPIAIGLGEAKLPGER